MWFAAKATTEVHWCLEWNVTDDTIMEIANKWVKRQFSLNNASLKNTLLLTLLCKSKFSLAMCCAAGYMYVSRNSWYLTFAKRVRLSIFLPFLLSHIHFNRSWWILFAHPVDARLNVLMKTILLWILPFPSEFIVMLSCVAEFIAMLSGIILSVFVEHRK